MVRGPNLAHLPLLDGQHAHIKTNRFQLSTESLLAWRKKVWPTSICYFLKVVHWQKSLSTPGLEYHSIIINHFIVRFHPATGYFTLLDYQINKKC